MDVHLMADQSMVKRILHAIHIEKNDRVLEIGAGKGALTIELAKRTPVTAIEIDETFCRELTRIPNVRVVRGNALTLLTHHPFDVLVSNLPYSISEPLFRMLPFVTWREAFLTIPEGFATLLKDLPYRAFFETTVLFPVPKSAFSPPPRTESVFVHCVRAPPSFLQDVFLLQRSKVKNALLYVLCLRGSTKRQARETLKNLPSHLSEKTIRSLSLAECNELEKFSQTLNTTERQ